MHISILVFLASLFACNTSDKLIEEVVREFENGQAQIIKYYKPDDSGKKILVKEVTYHSNGQKRSEGSYKEGQRDGVWTFWFEDGSKWAEGNYVIGIEQGTKTSWHPNGQKHFQGQMKDGERIGNWIFWDEEGNVKLEMNYDK
jgi:antitoxin component YwqK of YwqJK toxin-antitoxin module